MAGLAGQPTVGTVDLYTSNSDQGNTALGQLIWGDSGKAFRYVKVGDTALVVGDVIQSKAVDTQFTNMAVPATVASGVSSFNITNGTTAVTADEFKFGTLSIYTAGTDVICDEYTVMGNSAATNGAALTVYVDRPLRAGLSTGAKVNLRWSPYYAVIQAPATTLTGTIVGVAIKALAAGQYGWIQSHGVGSAKSDGTSILVGSEIGAPSGTAGAVTLEVAGAAKVGFAMQAAAAGSGIAVDLRID